MIMEVITLLELYPHAGVILDFLDHLSVSPDDHTHRVSRYGDLCGKHVLKKTNKLGFGSETTNPTSSLPLLLPPSLPQTHIHASSHSGAKVVSVSEAPVVSLSENLLHHLLGLLNGETL